MLLSRWESATWSTGSTLPTARAEVGHLAVLATDPSTTKQSALLLP
jgi:hypothetical protein